MKTSAKHESISPFPSAIAGQKRSIDQVNADRDTILSPQNSFNRAHRQDEFYIYEERSQTSVGINEVCFLKA